MTGEKILALHPDPNKKGVSISKVKYERIRKAILQTLNENETVRFQDLSQEVERRLKEPFDGSISWYVTTVKLDLEARAVIERVPGRSPQEIQKIDP